MEENRKKKAGIKLGVSHGSNPIRIPPITIHQSPPRITSIPDKFSFETVSRNDGDTHTHTHTQPHTHTHWNPQLNHKNDENAPHLETGTTGKRMPRCQVSWSQQFRDTISL